MSISIPYRHITPELIEKVEELACFETEDDSGGRYGGKFKTFTAFYDDEKNKRLYLPLGLWQEFYEKFPTNTKHLSKSTCKTNLIPLTPETDPEKKGRDQKKVLAEVMPMLIESRRAFLQLPTGYGKSKTSIMIHTRLLKKTGQKGKTVIVCFMQSVLDQWVEDYRKNVTECKIQYIKNSKIDPSADVYIIGSKRLAKFPVASFKDVVLMIIDEARVSTPSIFSEGILRVTPQYVIALSADVERGDGTHTVLKSYFGENWVTRKEKKDFTVIKYKTTFKPERVLRRVFIDGRWKEVVDFQKLISSLALNEQRTRLIASHIEEVYHTLKEGEKIMLVTERNADCTSIGMILKQKNVPYDLFIGTAKRPAEFKPVILANTRKAGIGFDQPGLRYLFLPTSSRVLTKQKEGRARMVGCIIYDYVDDDHTLENQWAFRESWYLDRGATVIRDGMKGWEQLSSRRGYAPKEEFKSFIV